MKLPGIFGKNKPVPFLEFRDLARQALRRKEPTAQVVPNDNGFRVTIGNARPIDCNLRNLYATYSKAPGELEAVLQKWIDSIIASADVPEDVTWTEAQSTLRPILKDGATLELARAQMRKVNSPDSLPSEPFLGDLHVIAMREVGSTLTGVTQIVLDDWGVTLHEAMQHAINNMSMMSFPRITNELRTGSGAGGDAVGLVFEDNHLTAAWILFERFRDFVSMRLQGDYVIAVPNRNRLIAVRSDEVSLLASIQQSNRNAHNQPHFLTMQMYHVSAATTGGRITIFQPNGQGAGIYQNSIFAGHQTAPSLPSIVQEAQKASSGDLNRWGFVEPTSGTPE